MEESKLHEFSRDRIRKVRTKQFKEFMEHEIGFIKRKDKTNKQHKKSKPRKHDSELKPALRKISSKRINNLKEECKITVGFRKQQKVS